MAEIKDLAIYSAVVGHRDFYPTFAKGIAEKALKGADLVLFTPEEDLIRYCERVKAPWRVVKLEPKHKDPARAAKAVKLQPHVYLPDHTMSMWIDANACITADPIPVIRKELENATFALHRHFNNVRGAYHEAKRCLALKKGNAKDLWRQIHAYRHAGVPEDCRMPACYCLMRRHHDPQVVRFSDIWWSQVEQFSTRDQVAFPYACWKTGLEWREIETPQNQWMKRGTHARRECE